MSRLTVEIGHTYVPDRPLAINATGLPSISHVIPAYSDERVYRDEDVERFQRDAAHLQRIREIARYFGAQATPVLFLDDVAARAAQQKSTDSWRWSAFINRSHADTKYLTCAEEVYYESDFEVSGRRLGEQIQNMVLPNDYRLSQSGNKLITGSGKNRFSVPLTGFEGVDDPTHPSCQVMDLAWLQQRTDEGNETITILPSRYADQQRGVEILANLVGIDRSLYTTVYYDEQ